MGLSGYKVSPSVAVKDPDGNTFAIEQATATGRT